MRPVCNGGWRPALDQRPAGHSQKMAESPSAKRFVWPGKGPFRMPKK